MANNINDLLGPTERMAVEQMRTGIEKCSKNAQALADLFGEIDTSDLETVFMNMEPASKDTALKALDQLNKLGENLSFSSITAVLTKVILNPKDSAR